MERKPISIAIDGPSGAGKSTVAKRLAAIMGYVYVDTGALYRTVGYAAVQAGIDYHDTDAVVALLPAISVELTHVDGVQRVMLNGEDVSDYIRTPEISMAASAVSAIPAVRDFLFETQQEMARRHNVIMDGRDIGTVVLPNAQVKIFLSASVEARAERRYKELIEKGESVTFEAVLNDMKQRDYNDSHRAVAPLKPAPGAIMVDTTNLSLEESVAYVERCVKEKLS